MEKYTKKINITYFTKDKEVNIDNAINKVVFLEVNSPLNYGLRTWEYYGRIVKVTKCYFEIIEYCDGNTDYWYTDEINKKENEKITKKWAKKSIQKLYCVKTENKIEKHEFYKN